MKHIFLILLFVFCMMQISAKKPNISIEIATYNLRYNNPEDGVNSWDNRKDWVVQLIRYHEWDVFGTQEGLKEQLDYLDTMQEYDRVGVGRDDGKSEGEHSAIFFRKSRFELLDKGDFWFSPTPDVPSIGWDAMLNRICSWAKLKDKESGKIFFFFSAHYDHRGKKARIESSKLIVTKIKEIAKDKPVVFVGDLNAKPESEVHIPLKDKLRDAYDISINPPYGPFGTGNSFNWERDLNSRIDYIYVNSKIKVLKYAVLSDSKEKRYPSDHLPVVARIVVE